MSKSAPAEDKVNEKLRFGFVLGWVWVAFALLNIIDILRHSWDASSALAGAILLFVTGVVFVISLRPRLLADSERVLIRNPLRDIEIPWGAVQDVEPRDTVKISTERRSYYTWVGHVPNRRRARMSGSKLRARSALLSSDPTGKGVSGTDDKAKDSTPQQNDTELLVQRLRTMSDMFGRKSKEAGGTEEKVSWSWPALAALGVPAVLIVLSAVLG